jgi:GxxExxY protein
MEANENDFEKFLADPKSEYSLSYYPLKHESYAIVGACMNVHNFLGSRFGEIIYKDALAEEFAIKKIAFEREKNFKVYYKEIPLKHSFTADFIVMGKILLEIKARNEPIETFYQQTLNYLAVTKLELALIVNFTDELVFKRLVMSKNAQQH